MTCTTWGLAGLGALDAPGAAVFARHGPTGHPPRSWMFANPPAAADWTAQLGGQTRVAIGPLEALTVVRGAWAERVAIIDRERSGCSGRDRSSRP